MSRRDAIRSVGWSPAQHCKKKEKTAVGVIATTIAARATRVVVLPFRAPAAIRQGSFDFVVNDTNPDCVEMLAWVMPLAPTLGEGIRSRIATKREFNSMNRDIEVLIEKLQCQFFDTPF